MSRTFRGKSLKHDWARERPKRRNKNRAFHDDYSPLNTDGKFYDNGTTLLKELTNPKRRSIERDFIHRVIRDEEIDDEIHQSEKHTKHLIWVAY